MASTSIVASIRVQSFFKRLSWLITLISHLLGGRMSIAHTSPQVQPIAGFDNCMSTAVRKVGIQIASAHRSILPKGNVERQCTCFNLSCQYSAIASSNRGLRVVISF
ncbi:hypothetical protein BDW71DRAFT_173249 [Aspergillus fruticulosus]